MALRIEDYAVIADTQTAALVGRDGSIDWLCAPRFDSPACFAALLGDENHGFWRIAPAGGVTATARRYRGQTLVLETEFTTAGGTVRVVDCMPPREGDLDVIRVVEGVEGSVPTRMDLAVRFGYGRTVPWVRRLDALWSAVAGPDALALYTPVELEGRDLRTVAEFTVRAGDRVPFVLQWHPSHQAGRPRLDASAAIEQTVEWWEGWARRCQYDGGWFDAVMRSLLTLKALTYGPTGGIVAAVTTSLPERIGGVRNWDYRYCCVDGLPGGEGTFLACTFWLADNYALAGRHDEAVETFERLLALRNDVGLLAEEWDVGAAHQLGNFPQAFSHVPLVNTARNLSRAGGPAEQRPDGDEAPSAPRRT